MKTDSFKQLDKTQDIVAHYLKKNVQSRDSTTFLYYLVLQEFYKATSSKGKQCEEDKFLSDLYDLLHYAPCDETVQRTRRKVQNDYKQYKPSKKVQEKRKTRQDDFKDWSIS
mgnify:FL=1|tara:strand:- start:659 stop:994 length:336 start_codon:yes stop_codon:yes gene_type:complete